MGQSQSQPASAARDPVSSPLSANDPQSPPTSPTSMGARRRRTLSTATAGARRRLSTFIRSKPRSNGDEFGIGEAPPRPLSFPPADAAVDQGIPSESISPNRDEQPDPLVPVNKGDSLRKRIFGRRTVAIPPSLSPHETPSPSPPTIIESPSINGYAHPGPSHAAESSTAGSKPLRLPSDLKSQTEPATSTLGQDHPTSSLPDSPTATRRGIALLSGTSAPISPASEQQATIDEDPAGTAPIPLTRTASWRSLVHQPSVENQHEMLELEIPHAIEDPPPMDWIPAAQPPPVPVPMFDPAPVPQAQNPPGPLPVVPMGTTMIIQGVVQAAEEPIRPRREPSNIPPSNVADNANDIGPSRPDSERTNVHAHLSGTFPASDSSDSPESSTRSESGNGEASGSSRVTSPVPGTTEGDSPSGAAELLSALLM